MKGVGSFMKRVLSIAVSCISLFVITDACAEAELFQRGWVGGSFLEAESTVLQPNCFSESESIVPVLPQEVKKQQSGAVFVSRVYDATPLALAGIRAGDLIFKINNMKVDSIKDLRKIIDNTQPGTEVSFTIYRDGKITDRPVKVGKETYIKRFMLGFKLFPCFVPELDIIPDPDFSLFSLLGYAHNNSRPELHSPEFQYVSNTCLLADGKGQEDVAEKYLDFNRWFVEFGLLVLGYGEVPLKQETNGS
jgi:hypothetical protein